jgi:hypothetical protein
LFQGEVDHRTKASRIIDDQYRLREPLQNPDAWVVA